MVSLGRRHNYGIHPGKPIPVPNRWVELMDTNRRFDEQESAFILERASADPGSEVAPSSDGDAAAARQPRGLTLRQLQEIAAEAGIDPEAVSRAAAAVGRGDLIPTERRTYVGLPVGVARTIDFPRRVSDEEWERMVVAFRETFRARGRLDRHGTLREWRNGNLQALLEPTARGHRLRISTSKGDARLLLGFGGGSLLAAVATGAPTWLAGASQVEPLASSLLLAAMGMAAIGRAAWMLPRWARIRASQMEALAERVTGILGEEDEPRLPSPE